jgi:hypothetical protein
LSDLTGADVLTLALMVTLIEERYVGLELERSQQLPDRLLYWLKRNLPHHPRKYLALALRHSREGSGQDLGW